MRKSFIFQKLNNSLPAPAKADNLFISMMKFNVTVIILSLLFQPSTAYAKLAPSKLSDLIHESDMIVRGKVVELSLEKNGGGSAIINMREIYKNKKSEKTEKIRITWSSEEHDQSVDVLGEERLLFLKKDRDQYIGTHYGRSYWSLKQSINEKLFTPYTYPITMLELDLPQILLKEAKIFMSGLSEDKWVSVKGIYLEDIVKMIRD